MKDIYNKLVRDKIPEIIAGKGDIPKTKVLGDEEYYQALNQKLKEEVAEYFENCDIEELADIVEVILAIVKYRGVSEGDFEGMRLKKYNERGGFDERICLVDVERKG